MCRILTDRFRFGPDGVRGAALTLRDRSVLNPGRASAGQPGISIRGFVNIAETIPFRLVTIGGLTADIDTIVDRV